MSPYDIRRRLLIKNGEFWIIAVCFAVYIALLFWRGDQ